MRDTLSNMVSCFLMSRQQAHITTSNSQFSHIYIMLKLFYFFIRYLMNSCCTTFQTHVRIQIDNGVFIRWNRRLLTKYRHENWHFRWFYFNMDKPAASKNRLKIRYCTIHQIDIPPDEILSSKSTISSKVLSESVLFSSHHCPAF